MRMSDLLEFTSAAAAVRAMNGALLDPTDAWDQLVEGEALLLQRWSGVQARVVRSSTQTCAAHPGVIGVCRKQLDGLFGGFQGDEYKTAIFFALAHEFGHLSQFKVFGPTGARNRPPREIEAHADILAGVWLGLRLAQGQPHGWDAIMNAALQFKIGSANYPSPYQRGVLVNEGRGQADSLIMLESRINVPNYTPLSHGLLDSDVHDLYNTAVKRLGDTPHTQ